MKRGLGTGESMETHDFLLDLLVILLAARIFAELATRLQSPSVIGELLAGVVLGPSLLGWMEPAPAVRLLAEIGIILLLFEVGLETDVRQLARTGLRAAFIAIGGFVLPFVFGFALGYWAFGLPLLVSLFIGGTLTATSIGITVRVLADLGRQQSREGQIVLGAAVLDDVFGVILLAVLYEFATGGGVSVANAGKVLLFVAAYFVLAPVAARLMATIIKRFDAVSIIPGLLPTTVVALVLFFAWLAEAIGAPELLGGFAAGLALSRRFFMPFGIGLHADKNFAHRIEEQLRPIVHLFTPIFFVVVGLSLNLRAVDWDSGTVWLLSLSLFAAAVLGKLLAAFLVPERWFARFMIGTAMVPRGEVGLIFAGLGLASAVFTNEIYAVMVIVIAFTTLLPPFFMKYAYARWGSTAGSPD
jgi:Kef-type K+ transport system membrane component KefB